LAKQFGEEFTAKRGWILMTGGKPKQSESKVKDAALFGCKKAHGLMVSILPKKKGEPGKVHCKPIIGERRVELVTDLTNYGRDPITGRLPTLSSCSMVLTEHWLSLLTRL
jgi:hypothetical protein